ncbi:MAG: hypothetical protein K9L30_10800 [Desulfobacterales bacterium]|nr:hypothetical protein [Desulfobacterales bacterium]
MLIYDDIYSWEGWGGKLRLGSGSCHLQIFDLDQPDVAEITHIKPVIVIVSDIQESELSVRSCASHIATRVMAEFYIEHQRMMWIEYYPEKTYGTVKMNKIPERFDMVDFVWHEKSAIDPRWRPLKPPLLDMVKALVRAKT